jgi:SAM-dependent methyltransferase
VSRRHACTLPAKYFEALYQQHPDPWDFASSDYERRKYAATLAALPAQTYGHAVEIGCSIGVFTALLLDRCRHITAVDGSRSALDIARARCAGFREIAFCEMMVPESFPDGRYDLIVLSEMLYFLDEVDLRRLAGLCLPALVEGSDMVLVHWLGETNYPLSGDDAAECFIAAMQPHAQRIGAMREAEYRLDILRKQALPGAP